MKREPVKSGDRLYSPHYGWGDVTNNTYSLDFNSKVWIVVFQNKPNYVNDGAGHYDDSHVLNPNNIKFDELSPNQKYDMIFKRLFTEEVEVIIRKKSDD